MQENCQEINRLELNQYISRKRKMMIVWRVSVCEVSGDGRMAEKKPAIINMELCCAFASNLFAIQFATTSYGQLLSKRRDNIPFNSENVFLASHEKQQKKRKNEGKTGNDFKDEELVETYCSIAIEW